MKSANSIINYNTSYDDKIWINSGHSVKKSDYPENSKVIEILAAEDCSDFIYYLNLIGCSKDQNFIVLPSTHHFYYDTEELKNIKTVVNLKQLNQINNPKDYLRDVFRILPNEIYYIGCFRDNNIQGGLLSGYHNPNPQLNGNSVLTEAGIGSKNSFLNVLCGLMGFRRARTLTKSTVSLFFDEAGIKVLDMTVINELTYFCAQIVQAA